MRVIAVANQKGGCGKTTTSINLSACLSLLHKQVLLIDLDPQGHSTCGLGIKGEELPQTLYDLFRSDSAVRPSPSDLLCEVEPRLWLIPTHSILAAVEEELAHVPDHHQRLKRILYEVYCVRPDIDYVILDCPPNLGILTYNALEAADEIMIPVEPSFFSLHGLAKMTETLQAVNEQRKRPVLIHALLTIFDSRTSFAKEVYQEVQEYFQDRLFKAIIHESVVLKEAAGAGQSIVRYDPHSSAFRDYYQVAREYLERDWDRLFPSSKLGWDRIMAERFGPKRVSGGVLFQAICRNASGVEIAGDFNNWIPEPLNRRGEELWQIIIPITNGAYRYKYIVDGEWQVDPYQSAQRTNAFGTTDSYLEL